MTVKMVEKDFARQKSLDALLESSAHNITMQIQSKIFVFKFNFGFFLDCLFMRRADLLIQKD